MRKIILLLFVPLFLLNCNDNAEKAENLTSSFVKETKYIKQWMNLLFFHVKHEVVGPPVAARIYSYLGITIYESTVHGMPEYKSFAGQLNELEELPKPESDKTYDWPTVMCEAMYHVADEMLANHLTGSNASLNKLHKAQIDDRLNFISKNTLENSVAYGKELASAILEWAATDGYDEIRYLNYESPSRIEHPEYYERTDFNQEPLEPFWGNLRPMVLSSNRACETELPHQYSTDTNSNFYKQAVQVYQADKMLTEEQRQIALYWADCPGETATPPGHWTTMMNAAIGAHNFNLEESAIMYGLVSVGMNDAFIQCWHTKYSINLVRPKTYIRENFTGEESWEPFVVTPPFPEFASGHSVVSGCVSELLTHIVGADIPFVDSTHVKIGLNPRSFKSFSNAAEEAAQSRLYGGMHYPMANEMGLKQGRCVAQEILSSLSYKK